VRTVFLGTSEFAAAVLRRLAVSAHRPALVITRPDRPRGRGRRLAGPPVAGAARELGIELHQPESVNDEPARALIARERPEAVCVCAFGALIREPLLSEHEMLNVHPSLLPRWRGAAPIERAIMAGDATTGVSIMRLTAGLDSGPVGPQREEPIHVEDTFGTLAQRLQRTGGDLLVSALDSPPPYREQDDSSARYAEKITARDRALDPRRTPTELARVVRALTPHIGAKLALADGTALGIWEARATGMPGPTPGELSFEGEVPILGCAGGSLELLVVQAPGKRIMGGAEYLRGRRG
jgi:methionyl-tRNA formyltransferase